MTEISEKVVALVKARLKELGCAKSHVDIKANVRQHSFGYILYNKNYFTSLPSLVSFLVDHYAVINSMYDSAYKIIDEFKHPNVLIKKGVVPYIRAGNELVFSCTLLGKAESYLAKMLLLSPRGFHSRVIIDSKYVEPYPLVVVKDKEVMLALGEWREFINSRLEGRIKLLYERMRRE